MSEIDWARVKERLRDSEAALREAFEGTPERQEALFRRRAEALAARDRRSGGRLVGVLFFGLSGRRYALPLSALSGVKGLEGWTWLPGASRHLLGLVSHRRRALALVSLAELLGLEAGDESGGAALILRKPAVALRVDEPGQTGELDLETLTPLEGHLPAVLGTAPDGTMVLSPDGLAGHSYFASEEDQS